MTLDLDWDEMAEFLVGSCGKTIKEAVFTSYREYQCLVAGYERREQEEWERLRWQTFYIVMSVPGKKTSLPKTPQSMFPFPWDKAPEIAGPCVLTPSEESSLNDILKNFKIFLKQDEQTRRFDC